MTPEQLRMARAALNVTQAKVAESCGIATASLVAIEGETTKNPKQSTLNALQGFYEGCGLEFTETGGVRPSNAEIKPYTGNEGFRHFYNDIYNTIKDGGSIVIQNGMPDLLIKHLGQDFYDMHSKRMARISPDVRVLIRKGDRNLIGSNFAEYRYVSEDMFNEQTIYIYGEKVGFITFGEKVEVKVLDIPVITQSMRISFEMLWKQSNELR
jgi:transcriptional regulator with XRE-family HTH domain